MTSIDPNNLPKHIAIIMDGNGRWAQNRSFGRIRGHQKGAQAVRKVVRTSLEIGIQWLTLYAFSEENWQRPTLEVDALMNLLNNYLLSEVKEMQRNGISLRSIGRLEKLHKNTRKTLFKVIDQTSSGKEMVLTLALSYGGRQEIVDALKTIAAKIQDGYIAPEQITEKLLAEYLYAPRMPDPDLLIRTSGEQRISNFLLWQIAYSELYLTPTLWPDFGRNEFIKAINVFQKRERRFGGI